MSQTLATPQNTIASVGCCATRLPAVELLAFVLSAVGLAGSIFLSLGMELHACPLCIMERTFLMGVVVVLLVSWLTPALRGTGLGCRLALPLALAGLVTASFHCYLEWNGTLVCPYGVLALGTGPQQSLAIFVLVTATLAASQVMTARRGEATAAAGWIVLGLVVGGALGAVSIKAGPPLPIPADRDTAEHLRIEQANLTLKGCRPVKK